MKRILIVILCIIFSFLPSVVFAQAKNTVYIYHDKGVSEEALTHTLSTFTSLLKKCAVKTINAQQVKEGVWTKNAILLIIPGGADLPYVKKLNGLGNTKSHY